MKRIGIISDTHGQLRTEVLEALRGVDEIIHAGDVVGDEVLRELQRIAPVHAVRGNNDYGEWAMCLPKTQMLEHEGFTLYVLHILQEMDIAPGAAGVNIIISGHTHKPLIEEKGNILYINPGSCGPRRFSLPVSAVILEIESKNCIAHYIDLQDSAKNYSYTFALQSYNQIIRLYP
ncbi:hypothetical protein BHU72_00620 [Desulfuribacillus stibiiarsenatis]|uniref:Phosphoesterase n=1 Tax=Desulfuribacillus stibiiarsenatis TaxID=1390249 RepID=A0A1E5L9G9_9FIRM|nr:metallophosphoesterase family protein [Desulfuribacillus stibiiarsenatis]OEH86807.1 hypothetical protein BHU72_00620 [Desulfuribacillus stibiiarsenatis]